MTIETSTTTPQESSTEVPYTNVDDIDFFPMFFASIQAALITIVANLVLSVFFALQFGAGLQMRLFARVLPYVALETDIATFEKVVFWSTVGTAALLIIFSVSAFMTRRSLRVQAGRTFAWFDVALLGSMQLYRQYFLANFGDAKPWMWGLVLVGLVGFVVCAYIVWLDAGDKEAELLDTYSLLDDAPTSAAL